MRHTNRTVHYGLLLALTAALGGCKTTQAPPPEIALPSAYTKSGKQMADEDIVYKTWWSSFKDPQLDGLMKQGLQENLTLRQAVARLEAAHYGVIAAGAGGSPSVTTQGDLFGRIDKVGNSYRKGGRGSGNLEFSWDLDLFGQHRQAKEGARQRYLAAAANVRAVRLAFQADLVSSYIDYQYFQRSLQIMRSNLESYNQTFTLTSDMRDEGIATNLDVAQAKALVDSARAELPAMEKGLQQAANHIATLLGLSATEFSSRKPKSRRQPQPGSLKGIGVPADLLRYRPDIRREEFLLASAASEVGVAEAQLYPALSLIGTIDVARLISAGATASVATWSFGPSIIATILDGGRLRANVDIAKADSRAQYLAWRQTVLTAVEEVENALISVNRDEQEMKAYRQMAASYEETRALALESFKGGTGIILDVLAAERSLGQARLALAESQRNLAKGYVSLQVAIGAGSAVTERLPINDSLKQQKIRPVPVPVLSGSGSAPVTHKATGAPLRLNRAS